VPCWRNRTFRSGRFGLSVSVWAVTVWSIRSGRFGLETIRSDNEILQKSYINAKYLNQWQVFFEHTLVNDQARENWGIWECHSREIWRARRKFFAVILQIFAIFKELIKKLAPNANRLSAPGPALSRCSCIGPRTSGAMRDDVWVDCSFLPDTPCAWEFSRNAI